MSAPGNRVGSFAELAADEVYEGVVRRTFSSGRSTVTSYTFSGGASFPLHRHPSEQVTLVEEGEVRMTIAGDERPLSAGDWSVVEGGVEHGITAGQDGARILAIVTPRRESADEYEVVEQP
jgi:quercetin dioxygenase-like cupin family protein